MHSPNLGIAHGLPRAIAIVANNFENAETGQIHRYVHEFDIDQGPQVPLRAATSPSTIEIDRRVRMARWPMRS